MKSLDNFKDRVCLGILTRQLLASIADGRAFMDMLISMVPQCAPAKYGNCEPIKRPFVNFDEAAMFWKHPFLWTCRAPRNSGSVWMNDSPRHTCIDLVLYGHNIPHLELCSFLKNASLAFKADFAYLHTLTRSEVNSSLVCYAQWHPFDMGVTTNDLRKGLPNLPQISIFGEPYVQLIGKSKLLASPAKCIAALDENLIFLQVEESCSEPIKDFNAFEERRALLKNHIGEDVFLGTSAGGRRRVPEFSFDQ